MRSTDFVSEYRAAGKVSVAGTIKLGNQFKDTYQVVNTPISHLYEVRIDDSPRESYPSYYFYNKDTGACVGSFSINAMPDAADDASPIVRPGVQIVQPHMTLAPEVQGKGLGSLIYDTFLAGGNWLFATFDHSSGAGALWDRMATKGSNISVLYNFNSDTVVEPGTKQAQTAVRILGPKERFKNKQGVAEGIAEARNSLFAFVKQQFPTWPDYVLKDFLYQQAKGIRDQAELDDFLKRNKQDFGNCKWTLTKLPITVDIFTPKTQRMLASREGGSSNPFQVPRDAERHAQQSQMIQQKGVSAEPIIVAKLSNGYDLIEGWHRTIQHLKAFPQGYTGPAWVCTGATYKSESVDQGVAEGRARYKEIEFVCANPDMCDATDPVKQQQLYKALTKIPGVIALYQDQSEYSEGQMSLSAIFKDPQVKKQILQTAKQFGVAVDLEQPVDDNYVDRAIRGEHYGQIQAVAEDSENYGGIQLSLEIEKDDEYVDDDTDNQTIYVKATANGRELGHVLFTIDYDGQGMVLNPQDLEVEEKYRGQGVAETMYDYVKSKGYRIRRSGQQTDAGAAFWNKHKPGQNVWEQDEQMQDVAEVAAPPGVSHFVTQRPTYRSPEKVSANHRVGITYTDDASPETLKKIVRVTANSPEEAIKKSTIYFKRLGWNVVDTAHLGTLDEAVAEELEEGWKDWVAGGAMALGAMGAQANSIVSQLVEPGDTVYSIARQNNVHPSVLYKLNGFNNNTKLTPGQEVKVPDVYTQTAKPAAKAPTAKPAIAQGVRGAVARANALRPVAKAQPKAAPAAKTVAPITGSKAEQLLMNTAVRSGITGTELAAFMAQMAHESDNFKSMKEYGGSLDFRKYDPKYAPKKAKTLGNKYAGDGNRFKGRGFIQITGRYNYRIASKAIGVDLVKNPKLAEDPAVAAKIAVWYWKLRVQPNVTNWNDVEAVTKPINPGLRGLEDRKENFADYITAMATVDKAV